MASELDVGSWPNAEVDWTRLGARFRP